MDPLTWVALALLAGGTYTQYSATKKAQNAQQKAILEAQRRQSDLAREKQNRSVSFAQENYDPETRAVSEADAARQAEVSLLNDVLNARENGVATSSDSSGTVTNDYSTDRAKSVAKTLNRASLLAHLIGKTRGPTDLRFNEGIKSARFGGDMADLNSLSRSRAETDQGLIGLAGNIDPRMQALGSLMQGAGMNIGMSQVGKALQGTGTAWDGVTPTLKSGQWNSVTPTKAVARGWFV
jgi:hypothetical protein